MLIQEARWFGARIAEMRDDEIYPMLNVGSHTARFRAEDQPWIDRYVFAAARTRGQAVTHLDQRDAPGVDLVGDLADPAFRACVAALQFRSTFAANILEHVADPGEVARLITAVVPVGGYLFVSCPFRFPYHPDPIDTMFRPDPVVLARLFPGTTIHRQAIVSAGTALTYLVARAWQNPRALTATVFRRTANFRAPEGMGSAVHLLPWMFRRFQETCVILRKDS